MVRSSLVLAYSVLKSAAGKPKRRTPLTKDAMMDYRSGVRYLNKLVDLGMVDKITYGDISLYLTNDKGRKYIDVYEGGRSYPTERIENELRGMLRMQTLEEVQSRESYGKRGHHGKSYTDSG